MSKKRNNKNSKKKIRTIKKISMVLDTDPASQYPLKYVLVQFKRMSNRWEFYEVKGCSRTEDSQFFYKFFVLSAKAYQYLQQNPKTSKNSNARSNKSDEVVMLKPDSNEYEGLNRYFFQIKTRMNKNKNKNENKNKNKNENEYNYKLNPELKAGIWTFFSAHNKSETGQTICLHTSKAYDVFHFLDVKEFPPGVFNRDYRIISTEDMPDTCLDDNTLGDIVQRLLSGGSLKNKYTKNKDENVPALKEEKNITKIQETLRQNADDAFKRQFLFGTADDYRLPDLQMGKILEVNEDRVAANGASFSSPLGHGRIWNERWDVKHLLPPNGKFVCSSPLGAGKTTFLRYLQKRILKDTSYLSVYITAEEVAEIKSLSRGKLILHLAEKVCEASDKGLSVEICRRGLDEAFEKKHLVLLIDGIDHFGKPGTNCSYLIDMIIEAAKGNPVIMAGRPTAARWVETNPNLIFLRLKPFGPDIQKSFFGKFYESAVRLCRGNKDILSVPMLACLVKSLIANKRDRNNDQIGSRWELYRKIVDHILWEHKSNRQLNDYDNWVDDIIETIGRISYEAIDLSEPVWNTVPRDLCRKILREGAGKLDRIPSCGIVDSVVTHRREGRLRNFVFCHQSFQEYFAAEWASGDPNRIKHVLDECWNPKWREVIKFLTGKNGQSIIESIYPMGCKDNPINSRLFFAAECIAETNINSDAKARITDELSRLNESYYFRLEALVHLVRMGGGFAHGAAWEIICKTFAVDGVDISELDLNDLKSLYNKERLDWVLDRLLNQKNFSCLYVKLLASWSDRLSDSVISKIIENWFCYNDSKECLYFNEIFARAMSYAELVSQLKLKQLESVISRFFSNERDLRTLAGILPISFVFHNVRLSEDQISYITELLDDPVKLSHLATMLNHLPRALTDGHVSMIADKWWDHEIYGTGSRYILMKDMPKVCARMSSDKIDDIIKALEHSDKNVSFFAANALKYCAGRLTEKQIQILLTYIKNEEMYSDHTDILLQILPNIDKELAREILKNISSSDQRLRISAMRSVHLLKEHICLKHIRQLEQNLKEATIKMQTAKNQTSKNVYLSERHAALLAIVSVIDMISDDTIWYICETLDNCDFYTPLPREMFTKLAKRTSDDQADDFVGRLSRTTNIYCVESLCLLINPEEVTQEGINWLCRILKYKDLGDSGFHVLDLLRKIYAAGRMKDM